MTSPLLFISFKLDYSVHLGEGGKGTRSEGKEGGKDEREEGKKERIVSNGTDSQSHKHETFSLMCFKLEKFHSGGERLRANIKAVFKNVKGSFEKEGWNCYT